MNGQRRVLCVSTDTAFITATSAQLNEFSVPISVTAVDEIDRALQLIEEKAIDGVVTDATTALSHTGLLKHIRRRHPQPALVVYLPFATEDGDAIAVADVREFADVVEGSSAASPLRAWVTETLSDGDAPDDTTEHLIPQTLVDEVKLALVETDEPTDIESAVCDRLVGDKRLSFAWIGEYDRGERRIVPWATACLTDSWPTSRTFGIDGESVIKRALNSRELIHVADIGVADNAVPWRSAAVERGCQSMALVPLCSGEELVGLMGVYSTDKFDETSLMALETIGETTGDVLGRMLVCDRIEQQGRSLRQYERLVETVGDGMFTLDDDGHFVTVNDTLLSMTGYNREGILGEPWTLLVAQSESISIAETIERLRAVDGSETMTFEIEIRRKDASTFPGENKIALVQVDGEFRGIVGVLRDVTERKRRERELERQNERVETFASIVSHDLRNPLGVAKGHLQRDACDEAAIGESLAALERMETIIDDVLALARHGDAATDHTVHELHTLAIEAWQNVDTRSARLVVDSSHPFVFDRSRVMRLLENCFRNAVEHGGTDSTVTVGCLSTDQDDSSKTGFYVSDDGKGLDPELVETVFDSEVTTSESGHGLGLWIVREVAHAHDWTVTATQSRTGGARFEFTGVSQADRDAS